MTTRSAALPKAVVVHIDGASRGNPGPAAYAVIIETAEGTRLASLSEFVGETTNNVAEYRALLAALNYTVKQRLASVRVFSDSELLVRQINGEYKVKSPDLKPLYDRALEMIRQTPAFSVQHIRREQNREADRLANRSLDAAKVAENSARQGANGNADSRSPSEGAAYRQGALQRQLPLDEEDPDLEVPRRHQPSR